MDMSSVLSFIVPGILLAISYFVYQRFRPISSAADPSLTVEVVIVSVLALVAGIVCYMFLGFRGLGLFFIGALGVVVRWYLDWRDTHTRPDLVLPTAVAFLVFGFLINSLLQSAITPDDPTTLPEKIAEMPTASLQFLALVATAFENGFFWKTIIKNQS